MLIDFSIFFSLRETRENTFEMYSVFNSMGRSSEASVAVAQLQESGASDDLDSSLRRITVKERVKDE